MNNFTEQKFSIPKLKGISEKNIEEHLKLYAGYVKHSNLILERIDKLSKNKEEFFYELGELQRRFSFEFNGMRNHEVYFKSFEKSPETLRKNSPLFKIISRTWDSFDKFLTHFKLLAMTRGIGWAILFYDRKSKKLLTQWVDEQHLGQLSDCAPILALDMWEHAYATDYQPSGKKQYIDDFFSNLNWQIIENNYRLASSK